MSLVTWDRKWKNKMKNEARKKKNAREEEDIQRRRDYVPPPTATVEFEANSHG